MDETFDLRADIAEFPAKEENAYFTMNFALLREVRQLRESPLLVSEEALERKEAEELLERKEAELKAATYTVEMMSTPRRRREDIYEESLEKFVPKLSFLANQVDEKTQFQRGNFVRVAVVAAGIKRIISPTGKIQVENILETVEYLHDKAPDAIFEILENKAQELNAKGDAQEDLHKSADF